MKTGILTLAASDNCGSLLQAYATQTVLRSRYGLSPEVLDFRCIGSRDMYNIFPRPWAYPRKFVNSLLHFPTVYRQKKDYDAFRRDMLTMSGKRFLSMEELAASAGEYDTVITGSDQVWNVNIPDFDSAYFLGWAGKARRIAYAPSLGGCDFSAYPDQARLKQWLEAFDALSVREQTGRKAVEAVTGQQVPILPDPTLLITPQEWQSVPGEPLVQEPYIFYYSWAYEDEDMHRIVQQYAEARNLKVYVIDAFKWLKKKPKDFGFTLSPMGGPQAFLNLMKYAQFAFVQSFHGVIFAHMMQKDFYLLDNRSPDNMDHRLASILKLLQHEDRVAWQYTDITSEPVDYSAEPPPLTEARERGFAYLDDALKVPAIL